VAGTPFGLRYQSDRVPGRKEAYTLRDIQVTEPSVPASLAGARLVIEVAGRTFERSFSAAPNQTYTFEWDGKDAYGRTVRGVQPVTVRVGYVYKPVYTRVSRFGYNGLDLIPGGITGNSGRTELTLWSVWKGAIGTWDARSLGLGGWTPDVVHAYDPLAKILYRGDGEQQVAQEIGDVIQTVAGNGGFASVGSDSPPGLPAVQSQITRPTP
jgi:hypothetical protein